MLKLDNILLLFSAVVATSILLSSSSSQFVVAEGEGASSVSSSSYDYSKLSAAQQAAADAFCAEYVRCSACLFDSISFVLNRPSNINCVWCPTTSTCAATFAPGVCPANRTATWNSQCEDMQCLGVTMTSNIYMCRFGTIATLVMAILLMITSAGYGLWYRVVQQAPWRYENLTSALSQLCENHGGPWAASQKSAKPDILSADPAYHISKKEERRSTYDEWAFGSTEEERFWTSVKRYTFFPLAISALCGVIPTFLVLTSSIRPYFADPYYGLVLGAGYGSLALMFVYVRLFQPSTPTGVPQLWIDLAIFLRGRSIEKAFPVVSKKPLPAPEIKITPAAAPTVAAAPVPAVINQNTNQNTNNNNDDQQQHQQQQQQKPPKMTPKLIAQRFHGVKPHLDENTPFTPLGAPPKVDEVFQQLSAESAAGAATGFELDEGIPSDFRTKVQELVKADESILWFDAPDRNVVGIEYNWMYQLLAAGLGFAVFLYVLSGAEPYPELVLPPAALISIALLLTVFCLVLFVVLSAGCKRIYILTNRRLIVIARSFTGTHNVNQVEFSAIQYCVLIGYREVNHFVMSVGWERVAPTLRRMPKLNTDIFVAVSKLDALLRLLIPRLPSNRLPATFHDDLVHQRYVWRVHASVNIASMILAPVVVLYSRVFPSTYGILAMLLVMFVNLTLLHRALRVLTTTIAPITVATGSDNRTDASFSVTKALQHVAETFPLFIPEVIRRAGLNSGKSAQSAGEHQETTQEKSS